MVEGAPNEVAPVGRVSAIEVRFAKVDVSTTENPGSSAASKLARSV
jgi:hypothetical protein